MGSITAELTGGYAVDIRTDHGHAFPADEPESAGGSDTGPNPYELLLGSLAACTCITISMYCQRKGWRLDRVAATFHHDRVHADDCTDCEERHKGYIDRVRSQVTIEGDFDEAARERLMQVAARCPVHKTLANGVHIIDEVSVS